MKKKNPNCVSFSVRCLATLPTEWKEVGHTESGMKVQRCATETPCGNTFTAVFPSGTVKRFVQCPRCGQLSNTSKARL